MYLKQVIKRILKKIVPKRVIKETKYLFGDGGIIDRMKQKRIIRRIRKTGICRTVIFVSSLPMMRYEGLRKLLEADSRFDVKILVVPFKTFSPEEKIASVDSICEYLDKQGVKYLIGDERHPETALWLKEYDPQLMLYPQPYNGIFEKEYERDQFPDALLAYQAYSITTVCAWWTKNLPFHNVAWRIFASNTFEKEDFMKMADNRGRNVRVTYYSESDRYCDGQQKNVWKQNREGNTLKRVIFAPHFQINKNTYLNRAAFLWIADFMLVITDKYKDKIQFAFKPHPKLKSELYKDPDWGKLKTDAYYSKWETGENTQLETGDYVDLFKTSDALIHNCGSFTAEYLFTGKPVLFLTQDIQEITNSADTFGLKCIEMHYIADCHEAVERFIENTVLGGSDPIKEKREQFRKDNLLPPKGTSSARNMYKEILNGLGM